MAEQWTCRKCGHVNSTAVSGMSLGRESFTDQIARFQRAAEIAQTRCASCGADRGAEPASNRGAKPSGARGAFWRRLFGKSA